jgi:hypothetical protein
MRETHDVADLMEDLEDGALGAEVVVTRQTVERGIEPGGGHDGGASALAREAEDEGEDGRRDVEGGQPHEDAVVRRQRLEMPEQGVCIRLIPAGQVGRLDERPTGRDMAGQGDAPAQPGRDLLRAVRGRGIEGYEVEALGRQRWSPYSAFSGLLSS